MSEIVSIERDELTGYRVGRCGNWYVRARRDGASFELTQPPFKSWNDISSEFTGLTLNQAARLLGLPQGDLFEWGSG